ncbi:HSP20 family protein [Cyclobacterium lianum]|uniref:HSP20 family protein n=1 Tax=Cyclobacterium lianum TaxID=388280 RepID=A0A1M7Q1D6_9BACT|nr:Hsp20/alpha crystallin family protein [Cyclobacterium lianum]SHN23872.1 HSP20 family protein [Cyclobacterium lianum]
MTLMKVANNGKRSQVPAFDNLFDRLFDMPSAFDLGAPLSRFKASVPAVNIKENDKNYLLELAVPGLKKEDFNISYENEHLVIASEKKSEAQEETDQVTRREFHYESFQRSFFLPEEKADIDNINAQYKDGILLVSIPKKEIQNKVKQITVG